MRFEKLGNIVDILSGFAFKSSLFNVKREGLPLIRVRDVNSGFAGIYYSGVYDKMFLVKNEDLLIGLDGDFKCVEWNNGEALLNQRVCKIIPKKNLVDRNYIFHFLPSALNEIHKNTNYTTVKHLSVKTINDINIPFPPLRDQLHISNILSKAEKLISQRKQSITLLDEFLRSTFLELFGDPCFNKKRWNKQTLRELSLRFSDGPFGSNLKTEHYSDSGIQVIRLQNIGINRFIEKDVSYVSEPHYENVLKKYSCFPNDVVIATMGSPNVRACIVPKHVKLAINKADCVLFRVNPQLTNQYYISHLINQEGFLSLATSFIHGQTRARISSGQLALISIPVPPIELQTQFAQIVEKVEALKVQYQNSLQELENLYGSLSQRAFRGELTLNPASEQVLIAVEPEPIYGKMIEFTSRECNSTERAILAGHIINKTNKEDFGRVKFQKLLHLTEYHCKIDIDSNFTKKVAGPHDGDLLKDIESTLKRYRYYDINQSNKGNHKVNYTPLSSVSELEEIFDSNFESERERIDSFLAKFRKSSWEQCEIISTLYAVWNNRLILNQEITDELLKQDFLNWDTQKVKYIGRLDDALQWMKTKGVIPDGWGKLIE